MTTNPMTVEEAIINLQAGLMAANPTGRYAEALTLAINRLSEPSGELVEAAKDFANHDPWTVDVDGERGLFFEGFSHAQWVALRAAILSVEGGAK